MPTHCKYENCKKLARYVYQYQKPKYCIEHGKIMKAFPMCAICRCGKEYPTYGFETDKRTSCCPDCKQDGMILFNKRKCEDANCKSSAKCFDFPGGKGRFCPAHKLDGMINVKSIICNEEKCIKYVAYDIPGGRGKYCATHKKEGMVDIKHPLCKEEGCTIINPLFGLPGEKGTYCEKHKKENMVDVRNKMCKQDDCTTRANFGYIHKQPEYCSDHKKETMIPCNDKMCQEENCKKYASFNLPGQPAKFCLSHKKENMINVTLKMCPGPPGLQGPDGICPIGKCGNPKYNYYCCECFSRAFPNDPRTHLVHKKADEILVRDFVNSNFSELNFVHDKPMWIDACDCSHKRRIDLRTLIGNTVLAIEVDEYQHKNYEAKDEDIRYDDLYMIHSGKWVFIRYNPNLYKDSTGKRANPWKEKRLRILREEIQNQINRIQSEQNTDLLEIHKLFFDGFRVVT